MNCENKCVDEVDMPIEEYRKRLAVAELRAREAEREVARLKECIVLMTLSNFGVLNV